VQTLDFFTPIVDDPFLFGQIAAANSLSDVYAMGGRPVTAMNIVGIPEDKVPPEAVIDILKGGAEKVREAGCLVVGGHTIQNPEPIYGLSVTGIVPLKGYFSNAGANAGDVLVLTKPLGTGIVTTAIKRGIAPGNLESKTVEVMRRLNDAGAGLAERGLVSAATDVTGFGLLGHLGSLCRASGVSATISAGRLPTIDDAVIDLIERECIPGGSRENLAATADFVDWNSGVSDALRVLATDAQTSGGLLLAVNPDNLDAVEDVLRDFDTPCAVRIGEILPAGAEPGRVSVTL